MNLNFDTIWGRTGDVYIRKAIVVVMGFSLFPVMVRISSWCAAPVMVRFLSWYGSHHPLKVWYSLAQVFRRRLHMKSHKLFHFTCDPAQHTTTYLTMDSSSTSNMATRKRKRDSRDGWLFLAQIQHAQCLYCYTARWRRDRCPLHQPRQFDWSARPDCW